MKSTTALAMGLFLVVLASAQDVPSILPPPPLKSAMPTMPHDMPQWISNPNADALFYKIAPYNGKISHIPNCAKDMYATGVGHAIAYEALVTGKAPELESKTFNTIDWVLKHQPSTPVDEGAISPIFLRKYGYLEKVFDWAHLLHFKAIDVLMHARWTGV